MQPLCPPGEVLVEGPVGRSRRASSPKGTPRVTFQPQGAIWLQMPPVPPTDSWPQTMDAGEGTLTCPHSLASPLKERLVFAEPGNTQNIPDPGAATKWGDFRTHLDVQGLWLLLSR